MCGRLPLCPTDPAGVDDAPRAAALPLVKTPAIARAATGPPLVSCLMPTADRPAWVARAIAAFARQTYSRAELVIVDDGDVALAEILGAELGDRSIVYQRELVRRSIGVKRNLACAAASGDVLIQWDDDDWHAPDRIAHQLAPIAAGTADVTALRGAIWFDIQGWRFRRPSVELTANCSSRMCTAERSPFAVFCGSEAPDTRTRHSPRTQRPYG